MSPSCLAWSYLCHYSSVWSCLQSSLSLVFCPHCQQCEQQKVDLFYLLLKPFLQLLIVYGIKVKFPSMANKALRDQAPFTCLSSFISCHMPPLKRILCFLVSHNCTSLYTNSILFVISTSFLRLYSAWNVPSFKPYPDPSCSLKLTSSVIFSSYPSSVSPITVLITLCHLSLVNCRVALKSRVSLTFPTACHGAP